MRLFFCFLTWVIASLATLFGSPSLAEGPSDKNPQMLLMPWSDESVSPKAVEWYSEAAALYAKTSQEVDKFEAAFKGGKVKSLGVPAVGMTVAKLSDLEQYAQRLAAWGEPAGHDLVLRTRKLNGRLGKVQTEMLNVFNSQIRDYLPKFQARCKKKEQLPAQIQKMVSAGHLDAAEKKYQKEYRELNAIACWYRWEDRRGAMKPFDDAQANLCEAIRAANEKDAVKTIIELRDKTRPDLTKLPAALQSAAKNLSSAATIEFGDKQLNGPKTLMAAAKEWHSLQRATLRTLALQGALNRRAPADVHGDVIKSYADFRKGTINGLAALIDADAARASETEAKELYLAYLKNIADIAAATRDDELIESFSAPLQKLADKSPALAADAGAYRAATDDWLRWRGRAAQSAVKGTGTSTSQLPANLGTRLDEEAPVIVGRVTEAMLDKPAVVGGGLLVAAKDGKPTSSLTHQIFARSLAVPPEVTQQLEQELLASAEHPPLSLTAARALTEARRGALAEVGGKVTSIELVGMIPFFAIASPDQRAVAPLGALPQGIDSPPQQLLIAADIDPDWVRGRCFFVKLK